MNSKYRNLSDSAFDQRVTLREAYRIMEAFTTGYHQRGDTPVLDFLSYLGVVSSGETADPAALDDWLAAARKIQVQQRTPTEHSLFDLLREIEKRPSMYVGWDASDRAKQLHGLEMVIIGFEQAAHLHHISDPGRDFLSDFGEYLRDRFGWSMSCGAIGAIRDASSSADDAWQRFWSLLHEYISAEERRSAERREDAG